MGTVIMHDVVSVDGFIADDKDDVGPLHDWYFNGETPIAEAATNPTIIPELEAASRSQQHRRNTSGRCGSPSARS